jgi:hypothetical protein
MVAFGMVMMTHYVLTDAAAQSQIWIIGFQSLRATNLEMWNMRRTLRTWDGLY